MRCGRRDLRKRMPRSRRLEHPNVPLHVIQRGNNRTACFFGDIDRRFYLKCLAEAAARRGVAVHAYALMSNHVHLLVTPNETGAVAVMLQDLGRKYVRVINTLHERTGTLWEGRYRSSLVASERYLLACHKYIELNPVRAGMVDHPSGYLWSSYAVNSGMRSDPLTSCHPEYLALAADASQRHAAYRGLFEQRLPPQLLKEIRDATNGGYPLASQVFKRTILEPQGYRTEPGQAGRPAKSPEAVYALE